MYINKKRNYLNKYIINKNYLFDKQILGKILTLDKEIYNTLSHNRKIFIFGNGGSASISEHATCDLIKNYNFKGKKIIISLTTNTALNTMISNDFGYDKIFSFQLENFANSKDLAIVISSSGNSKNIINAIKKAKKLNMKVFCLVGFKGGKVKKIVQPSSLIHIKSDDYGLVEDCHQTIFHSVISLSHQKF